MGESVVSQSADGPGVEGLDPSPPPAEEVNHQLVDVDPEGDLVLSVTFETSADTLRKSRKAALSAARKAGAKRGSLVKERKKRRGAPRGSVCRSLRERNLTIRWRPLL